MTEVDRLDKKVASSQKTDHETVLEEQTETGYRWLGYHEEECTAGTHLKILVYTIDCSSGGPHAFRHAGSDKTTIAYTIVK